MINSKITEKLQNLNVKYQENLKKINDYNFQINNILSSNQSIIGDKQNELSSITLQINTIKTEISNEEQLISNKIVSIKELPNNKNSIIQKEQKIHNNEIERIETKIKDIEIDHQNTLLNLQTIYSQLQSSINIFKDKKNNLDTYSKSLKNTKASLRRSILSSVHNKKINKNIIQSNISEISNNITSILNDIEITKQLIETKKTEKLNVNDLYYKIQDEILQITNKLSIVDARSLEILNGSSSSSNEDFETQLNSLYDERTKLQNELEILNKKPENDITGMINSKDNEISNLQQQLQWLDNNLQYQQECNNEIIASTTSNVQSTEISSSIQNIIDHKTDYDKTKIQLETHTIQLNDIEQQINNLNSNKELTLNVLEAQRTKAILRLSKMSSRSNDEMRDNEQILRDDIENHSTQLEILKTTHANLEHSKYLVEHDIYNAISLSANPDISITIKNIQNTIIKLERVNILLSKEISILQSNNN